MTARSGRSPADAPTVSVVIISKDEPALGETLDLVAEQVASLVPGRASEAETVVVDASSGRLGQLREAHPEVRWIDFEPPVGVKVSIPHQRNVGVHAAKGDIIVFTDSGCRPQPGWLEALLRPLTEEHESMTCGKTGATGRLDPYSTGRADAEGRRYLDECPTINLAFRRDVVNLLGDFDESFEYGSDIDFTWRARHEGVAIRYVPEAEVLHDWGDRRRQVRRSFVYGRARARLYWKHLIGKGPQSIRKRRLGSQDAVPLLYAAYLLGLPLAVRYRSYLLLLAVPLWRGRRSRPVEALFDHLLIGAGVLAGSWEMARAGARRR